MRVRTGFDSVVAHQTSESFACVADEDGVIENVDADLKLVRVRYTHTLPKAEGKLDLNLSKALIKDRFDVDESIFTTIAAKQSGKYPVGKIFDVNGTALFRVAETIPFASLSDVPELTALRQVEKKDLEKVGHVLYVRLSPLKANPADWVDVFQFGEKYTSISGSYLKQNIVLNAKEGDKVKKGDVIAYNSGFFEPDPYSKQVTWKHGVVGTVAFMDRSETYEDSCEISQEFGDRLKTTPGHLRVLEMTSNTAIQELVSEGDHVETTDYLVTMDDSDIDALSSGDDPETMEFLAELNRKTPRAKYHGVVAKIELYHACDFVDLHPSLKKIARTLANRRAAYHTAMVDTRKDGTVPLPQKVPVGTKYLGVDFADETKVAIFITIAEDIGCVVGDKLVLAAQAKTTIGSVTEKPTLTESGRTIDMTFSSSGTNSRILQSHVVMGIGESVLEELERSVLAEYFGDKK